MMQCKSAMDSSDTFNLSTFEFLKWTLPSLYYGRVYCYNTDTDIEY